VSGSDTNGKIGLVAALAFAVGTMVGAGVFVLSGVALSKAGPAASVAFPLAGVLVLLSALSFAVVASLTPPGGSGYAYVETALGRYWGFVTSWAFWVGGVIGVAFVLNAFGQYLNQFFVPALPPVGWALIAAAGLTLLNLGPASAVGRAEIGLVAIKVSILVLFIVFGFIHVGRADFTPFAPHGAGSVLATSALLFIAYLGFNVVTNMAGDVRRPHRTIPLAILLSMLIVALVYLGVVVALLAADLHSYSQDSVGTAARNLMGAWGGILIPIAALVSTLSAGNANILASSEIMVRLAAQRDVPTALGRTWHGNPVLSVLAAAGLYVVLVLSRQTDSVIALANVAAIIAMAFVNLAAIQAMRRRPAGALGLPLGPLLPVLGLVAAVAQLFFIGRLEVAVGVALVLAGSIVYLLRDRFHDPVRHTAVVERAARNEGPAGRALKPRRKARPA
jgi:basic amino acid/polyamine antiporter, APA family